LGLGLRLWLRLGSLFIAFKPALIEITSSSKAGATRVVSSSQIGNLREAGSVASSSIFVLNSIKALVGGKMIPPRDRPKKVSRFKIQDSR